ncbi:MAG: hypothetical protein ABW061_06735 [Polyangiaceae bacterium]
MLHAQRYFETEVGGLQMVDPFRPQSASASGNPKMCRILSGVGHSFAREHFDLTTGAQTLAAAVAIPYNGVWKQYAFSVRPNSPCACSALAAVLSSEA